MSHYYINDENLINEDIKVYYTFKGNRIEFKSNSGVFSKDKVDFGTNVLLNSLPKLDNVNSMLDIGCGIGIMGICVSKAYPNIKVTMADVNERCTKLSIENASKNGLEIDVILSDMYEGINKRFDLILSNPPIRAGKNKVFEVVDGGYKHLNNNGEIYAVIQKKQGAESLLKHMNEVFGNVEVVTKEKGYYILKSVKKDA